MAVLLLASSNHMNRKAIHSALTKGNRNSITLQPIAPTRKYGLRRPHLGLHVRSLIAPIRGWITRPVTGPARFSSGSSSGLAPMKVKIGLTADCCKPKLNWIPKNPKFISRMPSGLSGGLRASSRS